MRILYSHRIQSRDGMSVHVEELISALRVDNEVKVVGPSTYAATEFGGESQMVAKLRKFLPGFVQELAELAYNIPATIRLLRSARAFQPDFIYERYNLYFLAGSLLARWYKIPLFLEVNSPLAHERAAYSGLQLKRLATMIERFTWRSANGVFPVTHVLGDIMRSSGVKKERITVIPNGIVLDRFPQREPNPGQNVTLGFVGFVRDWHGLDFVIDAMSQVTSNVSLVIVGDGPACAGLKQRAARRGLRERVHFTGLVPHEEIAKHVMQFDIALQPAVTPYASPLKIFDYMAAGCAIVAPDQPNIREILTHERTALLFNPDFPTQQWDAISTLIEDAMLRQTLGANARAELEAKNYTWSGNAARIVDKAA